MLIPCQPEIEASSHAWIDAFFFRASAMLSQNQHLVLGMMKQIVPGSNLAPVAGFPMYLTALAEFADYAAMIIDEDISCKSALICVEPSSSLLFSSRSIFAMLTSKSYAI